MPELTQLDRTQRTQDSAPKAGGGAAPVVEQTHGNAAAQAALVSGPMGRVFNRILGQADTASNTAGMKFDKAQLQAYLDRRLQLAEGEFFRGKKLDGVADALMAQLDLDKDGRVGWSEFQVFEQQTLETMAPGLKAGASSDQVRASAGGRFDALDTNQKDGKLSFDELQSGTKKALPEDTDHKDLVAQLGARIALDAVDTDQKNSAVKDRSLGRGEWTDAAIAMAARRKN
jgi:EF hand